MDQVQLMPAPPRTPEATGFSGFFCEYLNRIPLDRAEHQVLQDGLARWSGLCRGRKFPAREAVTPRSLGALLPNTILIRVTEDRDYDVRIIGEDAVVGRHVLGTSTHFSAIRSGAPVEVDKRIELFDRVVRSGEPAAYNGLVLNGDGEIMENIFLVLPLGPDDQTVGFLLLFSAHRSITTETGIASLPRRSDPIWRRIAKGEKTAEWSTLAVRLMMTIIRNDVAMNAAPENVERCAGEIYNYFVRNVRAAKNDIAALFDEPKGPALQ